MDATSRTHVARAEARYSAVDLTDVAGELVWQSGISDGFLVAFCAHTTATLLINEWEDGALEDLSVTLARLFPEARYYAHDDFTRRTQNLVPGESKNGAAHIAQMVLGGSSQVIPVVARGLALGRWQRLFLWELDRPRPRTVVFHAFGSASGTQSLVTNNQNARPA